MEYTGAAAYLKDVAKKSPRTAARIAGSRQKLDKVLKGERVEDLVNPYRPEPYQLGQTAGTITAMSDAYEIAKAGGKHAGMLKNYSDTPVNMLGKGVRGLSKQIDDHRGWIASPGSKLPPGLDTRRIDHPDWTLAASIIWLTRNGQMMLLGLRQSGTYCLD